jgi:FkbM family methyltransferase
MINPADPLVIWHVGGEGDYGPAMAIRRDHPDTILVIFDAREDTDDHLKVEASGRTILINRCVDESVGEANFCVNKWPLSSSLLPTSTVAAHEDPGYAHCATWAQNTELARTVRLKTISIDEVVKLRLAPPPDVLSIDAQGAELRILKGATETLPHILCVVSEVEFFEIYAGQGLFDEQMSLLRNHAFRLAEIQNSQYWHPSARAGTGFHTVGEAVWLRYVGLKAGRGALSPRDLSPDKLLKLALIAHSFRRYSYADHLSEVLRTHYPNEHMGCAAQFDLLRSKRDDVRDEYLDPTAARAYLEAIMRSRTWRYTAPLRRLRRFLMSLRSHESL